MRPVLLDVNVLIALLWPAHDAHALCSRWFENQAQRSWASCALTQAGFVRIVSNPAFSPDAPPARQVMEHLARNLAHPGHQFWPMDLALEEAVRPFSPRLYGHRQVTDAYLLGLAIHHDSQLATLDTSIVALAPPASGLSRHVICLG